MEDLSQLLEEPVEADSVKSIRQRMMDKTVRASFSLHVLCPNTAFTRRFTCARGTRSSCGIPQRAWRRAAGSGTPRLSDLREAESFNNYMIPPATVVQHYPWSETVL